MVESTWTWPRYQKMNQHWKLYGPPVYLTASAYFKLGTAGRNGTAQQTSPAPPGQEQGNLEDLLVSFGGGGAIS